MRMSRSYKIISIVAAIALFLLIENLFFRNDADFRYTGIQIYDAVRDFKSLEAKGFDVIVKVDGTRNGKSFEVEGSITETYGGWFLLEKDDRGYIVEGPMGSKDVLASSISFAITPQIVVEAVYPPESGSSFSFRSGFTKFKGSIAFDGAEISPTLLQELRNANNEFYSITPNRVEVRDFGSGFILDVKVPVSISELDKILKETKSTRIQTGYLYYYGEAGDEKELEKIRQSLESGGAVLVNYYEQR